MTGEKSEIFDIFNFERAHSEINPVYFDEYDSFINYENPLAIFPFKGGISSTYAKLKIIMELIGIDIYDIHSIEINNPEKCNLKSFHLKRMNMFQDYLDQNNLDSISIHNGNVPLIDLKYLIEFSNLKPLEIENQKQVEMLEIVFDSTKDGYNPGKCELRAFAKINNFKK